MKVKVIDPRTGKTVTPRRLAGREKHERRTIYARKHATPAR